MTIKEFGWTQLSRKEIEADLFGTSLRAPALDNASLFTFVAYPRRGWWIQVGDCVMWHANHQCAENMYMVEQAARALYDAARWLHERPFCVPAGLDIIIPVRISETYTQVIRHEFDYLDCEYNFWIGETNARQEGQARHRYHPG